MGASRADQPQVKIGLGGRATRAGFDDQSELVVAPPVIVAPVTLPAIATPPQSGLAMKTRLSFIAALGVYCFALVANADAQQIKADTGGIAIGGNVTNSTIGISNELLAALVRQAGDLSEAQKKLIAKLEGELDLNQRQIHAALNILDEKDFPPDKPEQSDAPKPETPPALKPQPTKKPNSP